MNAPRNLAEYKTQKLVIERSHAWVTATCTVEEVRKVMKLYDDGLLTPGDVLLKLAEVMNEWADKN